MNINYKKLENAFDRLWVGIGNIEADVSNKFARSISVEVLHSYQQSLETWQKGVEVQFNTLLSKFAELENWKRNFKMDLHLLADRNYKLLNMQSQKENNSEIPSIIIERDELRNLKEFYKKCCNELQEEKNSYKERYDNLVIENLKLQRKYDELTGFKGKQEDRHSGCCL